MSLRGRPLKVNYAYHQIAQEIEQQILAGNLKPGEKLPGETELAEMFGVTRSTVREGLRQLESEGLVHRPTPRRLEVSVPRIDALTSRASRAMTLMQVTFRELWQVALATEPLAAELAAAFRTNEEIEQLRQLHAELTAAEDDVEQTIELDTKFHSLIAEMSKNPVLILAREPVALLLYGGFSQVAPRARHAARRQIEAHGRIVEAIAIGDRENARDWARRHIEDFWRAITIAELCDATAIQRPDKADRD